MPNAATLKILHILDHSLPLHSGYSFRSQAILRAQRKRGWEPVALTSPKHEESWKGPWQQEEEIADSSITAAEPLPGARSRRRRSCA